MGTSLAVTPLSEPTVASLPSCLREIVLHWNRLRGSSFAPPRKALDPLEIPRLLAHITLIEPRDGDYFYRLVGTHLAEVVEETGHFLSDGHFPEEAAKVGRAHLDFTCQTGQPCWYHGPLLMPHARYSRLTSVTLPMSEDGRNVSLLLVGCYCD